MRRLVDEVSTDRRASLPRLADDDLLRFFSFLVFFSYFVLIFHSGTQRNFFLHFFTTAECSGDR